MLSRMDDRSSDLISEYKPAPLPLRLASQANIHEKCLGGKSRQVKWLITFCGMK